MVALLLCTLLIDQPRTTLHCVFSTVLSLLWCNVECIMVVTVIIARLRPIHLGFGNRRPCLWAATPQFAHFVSAATYRTASSKHLNKYFEKNHMPDLSHICKCLRSYLLNACKVSTQIFGSITWQQLQSTTGVKLLSVTIAALIQWYILAYKLKLASCYKQRHCCKFCGPPCRQPLTRRWETHNAFDSQVAWICHAPDADLSPHARICRTANSDLSQHSPAACHCSQTRWWSGVIMSKYKHMCATLYTELG